MRPVYKVRTNQCRLGMEDGGVHLLHRFSAGIIISVAGIPSEMRVVDIVILECLQHLQLIDGTDFIHLLKGIPQLFLHPIQIIQYSSINTKIAN